ncbi:hypothetical protein [Vreelandella venusta]|uniref:Uncharacterized protein n=1 Tax=Vreelandella venusta TaxID=44935 RepID=A0ABX2B939_9GAMM|nr:MULTISPECIES: hypothetical protein [Halomonas]AZM96085.1 hypothetical protein EI420_10495 [Halomonas venusta]NPT30625.1 hypothetical protein [Halomonas venusta]WKD26606.1 hypothetical protein NDQ72_11020 [Halomonas sp. KG2]
MQTIDADFNTLMRQAPQTAYTYLVDCSRYLDEHFGEGYAEKHPELLAAMIRASAQDFHTSCVCSVMQDQEVALRESLDEVSDSLDKAVAAIGSFNK